MRPATVLEPQFTECASPPPWASKSARRSRAVGMINALNPISIVLPCHRVIGANGTLIGYAGGLERKKWLLEHEGVKLCDSNPRANIDLQGSLFEFEALM